MERPRHADWTIQAYTNDRNFQREGRNQLLMDIWFVGEHSMSIDRDILIDRMLTGKRDISRIVVTYLPTMQQEIIKP